jgi:hypothetical protein
MSVRVADDGETRVDVYRMQALKVAFYRIKPLWRLS